MISIIIPVFNAERYLPECLDSIIKQTYCDFEVICVNDGSSDRSSNICMSYVDRDARFKLIDKENGGVSSARNLALDKVKGDYVCFVDADDTVSSDFLYHLLDISQDGYFAICNYTRVETELGGGSRRVDEYNATEYINLVVNEAVQHPNICMMLFKTSIIKETGLRFTLGCVRNEDYEFYMKYMSYEKQVHVSNYKAYFYRDNLESASHKYNKNILTAVDADSRLSTFLVEKGIIESDNLILPACVQFYVYQTARQKNYDVYECVHHNYDVKQMMKNMTNHPRLARRAVAWTYRLFGKKIFYLLLSHI